MGFCECGCGKPTKLSPQSSKIKGWVKGKPMRYIFGHHPKKGNTKKGRKVSLETRIRQSKAGTGGKEPIISPFLSRPTIVRYVKGRWVCKDEQGNTACHARMVYIEHKGKIPEKYHIHHINGDSSNLEFDHPNNLLAVPEIWNLMFFTALSKGFGVHESKITEFYIKHMNQHTDTALFFAVCKDLSFYIHRN